MRYQPLPASFHQRNRRRLAKAIGDEAIAIIDTADIFTRRGDFEYPFRPDSNFYYVTGINEPEAVLVLVPGHANATARELLFISGTSDFIGQWQGDRHTAESASRSSGIETVLTLDQLDFYIDRLLGQYHTVYVNAEESLTSVMPHPARRRAAQLRERAPLHQLKSVLPVLDQQRAVKSPEEVVQIRRAIAITNSAIKKAQEVARPGLIEHELEAELVAEFTRAGARAAWPPIVASGPRATIIHYEANSAAIGPHDLILVDTGAEYGYYAADISRTWPVSGRFTSRQQAVYDVVREAQAAGLAAHRPGISIFEIDEIMQKHLQAGIKSLGLTGRLRDYYPHVSHHLGLDIHDTGTLRQPLQPGAVVTCEPGLYIKDEGIGIRLEDDILITDDGYELLS